MNLKQLYRILSPKFQKLCMEYPVDLKPRWGGEVPHSQLYSIIDAQRNDYAILLNEALECKDIFAGIKKNNEPHDNFEPTYNNEYLPGLDIIGIYTMLKHFNPETYVEVGSGFSTKVAAKSIRENHLQTKIVSIDPQPRAEIDELADKVIREPFENTDFSFIFNLKENDILFIDNSHRILPNSDAMVFFMEVLPNLPKGVVVHVHDIYLPYDYPQFMCDRFYSEQYGLAAFLLANSEKYQPILPNFFISQDKELHSILNPIWEIPALQGVEHHGGSFWLKVNDYR